MVCGSSWPVMAFQSTTENFAFSLRKREMRSVSVVHCNAIGLPFGSKQRRYQPEINK